MAIVATGTGVGPELAAAATARLLSSFDLDHVVVSGIAGGIEGASAVGDGVVALDMETAAVARVCDQRGVPWMALRGISDMAGDESVGAVVLTLVRLDGSPDTAAALRFLVAHPRRLPPLLRLARESGRAAGIAAQATALACRRL